MMTMKAAHPYVSLGWRHRIANIDNQSKIKTQQSENILTDQ